MIVPGRYTTDKLLSFCPLTVEKLFKYYFSLKSIVY